jgi:hypothetical protein
MRLACLQMDAVEALQDQLAKTDLYGSAVAVGQSSM